jgi:hypothetical protein
MNTMTLRRWLFFGAGFLLLTLVVSLRAAPVVSQGLSNQPRFEYRVIKVSPDERSIQAALTEYGYAGRELAAFEMDELRRSRLIFKKGVPSAPKGNHQKGFG